jgi:Leucine-rich repeat (LRR) protein
MNRLISFVAMLFLITSCTSEIDQINSHSRRKLSDKKTVFFASAESTSFPETKVYADENLKVLWNADDWISIFDFTTYNSQFAFTGDDGDTAGGFEQVGEDGEGSDIDYVYAAYPYNAATQIDESGILTMMLPAEQQYKEDSFGIGANTMVAVTDGNFLAFKNVGGFLSLRLFGDNVSVSKVTIKGNNGEKIAGKASVSIPLGGLPTVMIDETATDEISIVCDPAVKLGEDANNYTDFWFVIPPVTFEQGFTITVTDDKGVVFEKATSKSFTVSRNTLDWMSALKVVPNYDNAIVPFEDANFKAYCVENFDNDGDGEISFIEAMDITDIHCDYNNYYSLEGIEYFQNLVELSCSYNQLSILDVSRCTNLTVLNCANNQLTNLNVSGCTKLLALSCDDNQLASLDVSNCKGLIELGCTRNQLTSLDFSDYISLTRLLCYSNNLSSLIVKRCLALTELVCDDNQLTSLDVSGCSELSELSCSNNLLTSLNLSGCTALTGLWCDNNQLASLNVSGYTALSYLTIDNNGLSEIDVSGCTALTNLYMNDNSLTSIIINGCTVLQVISFNNSTTLTSLHARDCKQLTSLQCHENQLNSLDVSGCTSMEQLYCYNNKLNNIDLSGCTALATLYCQENQLTNFDVSDCTALSKLYCYGNQLTSLDVSDCTALSELVCDRNQLTSLDVSCCTALATLDCQENQLTSLDVSNNSVLSWLVCNYNPSLLELKLKKGQTINFLLYDSSVTTITYKD